MKKLLAVAGMVSLLGVGSVSAAVTQVIAVTGGSIGGINELNSDGSYNSTPLYHDLGDALNNQPTGFDTTTGVPIGQPAVGYDDTKNPGYGGGWGYIDFGPDWANVRITQAWTLSRGWAHGPASPYQELYWHNDVNAFRKQVGDPVTIPGATFWWQEYIEVPGDAIPETTLNFVTHASSDDPDPGAFTWTQDLDLSPENAITPGGRYLVMKSANPLTPFQEIAIGGYIVPEPGSAALLAVGAMGMLARRRRTAC
jgi:hypothetical protein